MMDQFRAWILTMFRQQAPIVFNGPDWGFAGVRFPEHGPAATRKLSISGVTS